MMKKKLFSVILAAVMVLTLAACSAGPGTQTRYFMTEMVTTQMGNVTRTVYDYDEAWEAAAITIYQNDELLQQIAYELDDHGTIKSMTATMADGSVSVEAYVNTYDEDGNLIRQEHSRDGELTSTNVYTYESGVRTGMQQTMNMEGIGEVVNEYTYNPDGTTAVARSIMPDGSVSWTEYTYDAKGNEVRSVSYSDEGTIRSETITRYDADGNEVSGTQTNYDPNGNLLESYSSVTETEGNVHTTRSLNVDGAQTGTRSVVEYDEAGNMIRNEIYSGEELIVSQICTYQAVEVPAE